MGCGGVHGRKTVLLVVSNDEEGRGTSEEAREVGKEGGEERRGEETERLGARLLRTPAALAALYIPVEVVRAWVL